MRNWVTNKTKKTIRKPIPLGRNQIGLWQFQNILVPIPEWGCRKLLVRNYRITASPERWYRLSSPFPRINYQPAQDLKFRMQESALQPCVFLNFHVLQNLRWVILSQNAKTVPPDCRIGNPSQIQNMASKLKTLLGLQHFNTTLFISSYITSTLLSQ